MKSASVHSEAEKGSVKKLRNNRVTEKEVKW